VRPADPANPIPPAGFWGFGRLPTGADGECVFQTIRPGAVRDERGGAQAPHINVCFFARGLLRPVYTRIYLADRPELDTDPILALVPQERRATLVAHRGKGQEWTFDIRLQGGNETVFFDL
jgi:protocatechuate 3,4-dioxygenase alpha subunit